MTLIDRLRASRRHVSQARTRAAQFWKSVAPAVLAGAIGFALAFPAGAQNFWGDWSPDEYSQTGPRTGERRDPSFATQGGHLDAQSTVRLSSDGRYENVIVGPSGEAAAAEALLNAAQAQIIRRHGLAGLDQYSFLVVFPTENARNRVISELPQVAPGSGISLNWTYRMAQSRPRLYASAMIGDSAPGSCQLARRVRIGMLDGPVNTAHPALRGASVRHESLATTHRVPSSDHGTGVAALMVGEDVAGGVSGFARGASLHAVSVFERIDTSEESTVELLVLGLDRLAEQGVDIINLSVSGPQSAALGRAVAAVAGRGVVLIGAAGNDRARSVAYPAAFPEVIAVTAIDAARRRFVLANTGPEIEFSAPGVDVFTARGNGGGYVSGTSFAAPIVTSLAARLVAEGIRDTGAIRAALRSEAEAIGGGRNAEFGYGLVRRAC